MDKNKQKRIKKDVRHNRVRAKVSGSSDCPRLCVFRSGKHIYAQLIDDISGKTLASASSLKINKSNAPSSHKGGKTELKKKKADAAKDIGKEIAQKASDINIVKVVFDRGGYKYHGRVKALAEGAREGGLRF